MSGVAKSTVSRYLNGGSVKDATAQKIKKIIEENNYEPNLFARLNAKESRIIGLTVPGFNSVTTPRLVEVIVAYLKKNDYTPLIMHTENDIEEEIRCIERLKNMNVDGIMVLATGSTKEYEEAVKKLKIPILFLGQRFPGENSVINDDYNAGYAVGNYIGQRKFKEIYMLWVPEDDPAVGGERRHGVIDGLMSCEKKPKEVIETTFFYENAIENVQKFVDHMKTPAAVVCATDRIAFGVYKVMSEKGIRIPEEVSVVGFGDYEAGELLQPPLTTVKFDWKNWGEISAESMIQMILGKPVSPLQVNPYEIIERKGATYYGIGMAAARIAESIIRDSHTVMPVSVSLNGEYGLSGLCLSIPAIVGKGGAEQILEIRFSTEEMEKLGKSADELKSVLENIK